MYKERLDDLNEYLIIKAEISAAGAALGIRRLEKLISLPGSAPVSSALISLFV